jgi:hypothetical protein
MRSSITMSIFNIELGSGTFILKTGFLEEENKNKNKQTNKLKW